METENKNLIQKFENIDFNKNNKVPEFYLNKFSMIINTNSYYYMNPDNNWKYATSEMNLSGLNVIISLNMENNIIIFYGYYAPENSYYSPLNTNSNKNRGGIYYDNKFLCPINNKSNQDSKVVTLYGKLIV